MLRELDDPWPGREFSRPKTPVLRFTPYAWAKLMFFRDLGDTEIGGFGITREDPLLIEDFVTVLQEVSTVTVKFDDAAVADFYVDQVEAGRQPHQFGRIWIHTHPGRSPSPSGTDEETFARVFGKNDWAVMFILAKYGETYARLRFNVGPGGDQKIETLVDFNEPFDASDWASWTQEYEANIFTSSRTYSFTPSTQAGQEEKQTAMIDLDDALTAQRVRSLDELDDADWRRLRELSDDDFLEFERR